MSVNAFNDEPIAEDAANIYVADDNTVFAQPKQPVDNTGNTFNNEPTIINAPMDDTAHK